MTYSIKEAAERMGVTTHTLRYYDREGLLPHVGRTAGGMRRFSQEDLDGLALITCLKATGMSIRQIKDFLDLSQQGDETLNERRAILKRQREQILAGMRQMQEHLERVERKIAYYDARAREREKAK